MRRVESPWKVLLSSPALNSKVISSPINALSNMERSLWSNAMTARYKVSVIASRGLSEERVCGYDILSRML